MKKLASLLVVASMLTGVLVGCGSGNNTPVKSAEVTSKAGDTEVAAGVEPIVLKAAHAISEQTSYHKGMEKFKEEVEKRTEGKIKIELYPNGQLGNERDAVEGMQLGTIDITLVAAAVLTSFAPDMAVLDYPFAFDDAAHARRFMASSAGDKFKEQLKAQQFNVLGYFENGFRNVYSVKPIRSIEDFKGVKIRTMENEIHMAAFNKLGAIATPMASGEVFAGLQQKTIDAAENASEDVITRSFHEVVTSLTRTGHVYGFLGLGISDMALAKIPADLVPAIEEAGKIASEYQAELITQSNTDAERDLPGYGVEVYDIDREALAKATQEEIKSKFSFNKAVFAEIENTRQ
ncbi:MAG: sialic acid-binding protein [Clostridia bacterium]|jgi:tripartite ATP-independent transporter DctP family solute receptor|nr:sialic acid-binding protein [Clostridia bacterium]